MIPDASTMNRGLLLALAEICRTFPGDFRFHEAHRAAMASVDLPVTRIALEDFDMVFGVSLEGERMLLEGERDLLIRFNGRLGWVFKITRDGATMELLDLTSASGAAPGALPFFRIMANKMQEVFDEQAHRGEQ